MIARTPRAEPHQHKVPDLDTVKAIIAVADPRMATVIRLAIATGARRGELGALKWSDIDARAPADHVPTVGGRWRAESRR
jgi:integrase